MTEVSEGQGTGEGARSLLQRLSHAIVDQIRWLFRVLISSLDRFYWDNGFSRAASLAYTSLLSLFPVTALIFGLLAIFAVSNENISNVREFVFRQFVPNSQVVERILFYMGEFGSAVTDPSSPFNLLAFGFLIITSILLINSIEYALNEIWQVFEARRVTDRITIFSAMLLLAPILAISAFYFAKLRVDPFLRNADIVRVYTFLVPFLIDYGAFFCLNYLVPKAPVKVTSALFGAFLSSLLFGCAKAGFAIYIERFASYDRLYGALAVIPIFLIWLYVSWIIVLLGAESAYQAQYLPKFGKVWRRSVLSVGDARMVLAMQALTMITKGFLGGQPLPNDLEIAETLGCSSTVLKPALSALEKAGIIARGRTREMPLTLLKSPETITLLEIRDALFQKRIVMRYPEEMSRLFQYFKDQSQLGGITLAQITADGSIPKI
jgi:membrane protein